MVDGRMWRYEAVEEVGGLRWWLASAGKATRESRAKAKQWRTSVSKKAEARPVSLDLGRRE